MFSIVNDLYFLCIFLIISPDFSKGNTFEFDRPDVFNGHTNLIKPLPLLQIRSNNDITTFESLGLSNFINATLNVEYNGTTLEQGNVLTYKFEYNRSIINYDSTIRIKVESQNANKTHPVLFVVRQEKAVMSWQIPLILDGMYEYHVVAHTLCPIQNYLYSSPFTPEEHHTLFIDISSTKEIFFSLEASKVDNFILRLNDRFKTNVTASKPQIFQYNFKEDEEYVMIQALSPDTHCMVMSVQNIQCPVFDLDRNVGFRGLYQTMTKKASITVRKQDYKEGKFYVVLVLKPNDLECLGSDFETICPASNVSRVKHIELLAVSTIKNDDYVYAGLFAALAFVVFYIYSFVVSAVYFIRGTKIPPEVIGDLSETRHLNPPTQNYGSLSSIGDTSQVQSPTSTSADSSLDETDLDLLPDAEYEKDIVRTRSYLYVADLSRKRDKKLTRKARLYTRNLLTLAIFYAIPVVQLVYTYQKVLHTTGNQDICYYNFMCSHPLGVISDFNHVYSNFGYVLLGILFLGLVFRREATYNSQVNQNPRLRKYYGIPQHYGLFYSMGVALIMEGILSACYHICPNSSNFQFDTAFMYIIASLYMLKIYQTRHPDINAHSHSAYLILAIVVILGVIGVLNGSLAFWIVFSIFYFLMTISLTAQIYYMGRWKFNIGILKRIYHVVKTDILTRQIRPTYPYRFVLLAIGNVLNWGWSIYGLIERPHDFASYLLVIFMTNLLLYLAFYIIMKLFQKEKIYAVPLSFLVLSLLTWSSSFYFFLQKNTSWQLTPAQSRESNHPCILLNFFDHHDVWHFFSSAALFFSFMILLTLDDDLTYVPRDKIPVF